MQHHLSLEPASQRDSSLHVSKSRRGLDSQNERERQRESVCREREVECELVLKSSVRSKKQLHKFRKIKKLKKLGTRIARE